MRFFRITEQVFHAHVAAHTEQQAIEEFNSVFGDDWFADEEWDINEISSQEILPISFDGGPMVSKTACKWYADLGPGLL